MYPSLSPRSVYYSEVPPWSPWTPCLLIRLSLAVRVGGLIILHLNKSSVSGSIWSTVTSLTLCVTGQTWWLADTRTPITCAWHRSARVTRHLWHGNHRYMCVSKTYLFEASQYFSLSNACKLPQDANPILNLLLRLIWSSTAPRRNTWLYLNDTGVNPRRKKRPPQPANWLRDPQS